MKHLLLITLTIFITKITNAQSICVAGNCTNGFGTLQYDNGDKYIGQFEASNLNGEGVYFYANGNRYAGSWKDGLCDGEGRLFDTQGLVKKGIWKKDKFVKAIDNGCISGDCEGGYGVLLYDENTKYAGMFENGKPTKRGVVYYSDGRKYMGEWENHEMSGKGALYTGTGEVNVGIFVSDSLLGEAKNGYGCVSGDCKDGVGTYVYKDNTMYEGQFKNSLAHGIGTCYYGDGDVYNGQWKFHTFDGLGTLFLSDGTEFEGHWSGGDFQKEVAKKEIAKKEAVLAKAPKIWALVVGVARYNHMQSLKYADDDAYQMYAFLKSPEGGALADKQVNILVDEAATKENILNELDEIVKLSGENDVVMIYFSGHGRKGHFLTSDAGQTDNELFHTDIIDKLEDSPAKIKILIADACHSGSFQGELMAAKSGLQADMSTDVQSVLQNYYRAFDQAKGGTALILSSRTEQSSYENQGLRQGIFSHFLIRGLKGAADADKNYIITVNELFEYIHRNVSYYTEGNQTPVLGGEHDKETPLGIVRE